MHSPRNGVQLQPISVLGGEIERDLGGIGGGGRLVVSKLYPIYADARNPDMASQAGDGNDELGRPKPFEIRLPVHKSRFENINSCAIQWGSGS